VVTEIWRVTVFVWKTMCAALLPIALRHVAAALPRFLDHLGRSNEQCRKRRIDTFRETIDAYAENACN